MLKIDLHTHSRCSDGLFSVSQLVKKGKRDGVLVMSLTDHDTIKGVPDFVRECNEHGISPLTGIELSAQSRHTLHILGYRISLASQDLAVALEDVRQKRDERNLLVCEKLQKLGFDLTMEDIKSEASGDVVARPHFARVLVRKCGVSDIATAFRIYLGDGRPAYAPRKGLSAGECIEVIRKAGGVAVLAHPQQMRLQGDAQLKLVEHLKEDGLWGIECISPHHTKSDATYYLDLAKRMDLFPTAGSDFHGAPSTSLGVKVEDNFLPWARLGIRFA